MPNIINKINPASTQPEQTWELIKLAETCDNGPEKIAEGVVDDLEIERIANACITLDKELFDNSSKYYKYSPEYMNQLLQSAEPPPGIDSQVSALFRPGNNSS
jgi:hypothetical protein